MSKVTDGAKLFSGAIVSVNSGKVIPKEYVEAAVKNKSCIGICFAIPENNEVKPARTDKADATLFEGTRNALPGITAHFWLGATNKGAAYKPEDLQPFVIATDGKTSDGNDKPTVCVMLDGDFTPFIKDNGHSEHYNFAFEFLKPKIEKVSKLVDGDLDKLTSALSDMDDDIFARDIPSGFVMFILGNGKTVLLKKNYETAKETSFGLVSDTYGWSEQTEAPAAASSSGNALLDSLKSAAKNVAAAVLPSKTDTAIIPPLPAGKGTPYILRACPKSVDKKKLIEAWYITETIDGKAPEKYWTRPEADCKVPKDWKGPISYKPETGATVHYKSFNEYAAALEAAQKAGSSAPVPATASAAPTEAPATEEPQTDDGDASNGEDFEHPVIPDTERKPLEDKILVFQNENKDFVQDPKSMQEWITTRETFNEAMGIEGKQPYMAPDFTPAFLEDMFSNHEIAFWTWAMDQWTAAKIGWARVAELEAHIATLDVKDDAAPQQQPQAGLPPPPSTSKLRKSA